MRAGRGVQTHLASVVGYFFYYVARADKTRTRILDLIGGLQLFFFF